MSYETYCVLCVRGVYWQSYTWDSFCRFVASERSVLTKLYLRFILQICCNWRSLHALCVRGVYWQSCTWDSFCSFVAIEDPAHTISVESTLALNPWCFGTKSDLCPHLAHILPSAKPSMIHWMFSPNWKKKKIKKLKVINTLQMADYCPTFRACTPLTQVPYIPTSLPRALRNIKGSCMNGAQALKCCKKDLKKKHIQDQSLLNLQCCMLQLPDLVLCPSCIPEEVGVNQMWYAHKE
jgi:hypothetical protein